MGDAAKNLKKLISAGDDDSLVKAFGTAEDIYGTMSGLYGYYGAAKDILIKFGVLGKPEDPLEKIAHLLSTIVDQLNAVLGKLEDIKAKIDAGSKLTTWQLTDAEITWVKTEFDFAVALADNANDYNKLQYDLHLGESWNALNLLIDAKQNYWKRLFGEDALYGDVWTEPCYPDDMRPDDSGRPPDYIWDYRLTLPQYIQSLQRHLFIVSANSAEYQTQKDTINQLTAFGDFLFENVYKRILSAFASIGPPKADDMKYVLFAMDPANFYWHRKEGHSETFSTYDFIDPKDGRRVRIQRFSDAGIDWLRANLIPGGNWVRANYVFGEVERYSGYDCTARYPLDELKAGAPLIAFGVAMVDGEYNNFGSFWWIYFSCNFGLS